MAKENIDKCRIQVLNRINLVMDQEGDLDALGEMAMKAEQMSRVFYKSSRGDSTKVTTIIATNRVMVRGRQGWWKVTK
jgi:hypothetical protein